jgi:hypothetical protein
MRTGWWTVQAVMVLVMVLAGVVLLWGCANIAPVPVPVPVPNAGVHGHVRGVFVGLTMTSPYADNLCPGADVDATRLLADAQGCGVEGVLLLNSTATWEGIKAEVFRQAGMLVAGDMLALTLSGHGGQVKDDNGDETDGLDETLCLFAASDSETVDLVRDDRVMAELLEPLWTRIPVLEVLLITDTCHAQGSFRVLWETVTLKRARAARALMDARAGPHGGLVQIAMCREAEYSYGTALGGTGTQALLLARQGKLGRLATFYAMRLLMKDQEPVWVEDGAVSEVMRNGEFWR